MTGYRFMVLLRRYYTVHRPFVGGRDGNRRKRNASSIETYMVFGLEKMGEFRWGLTERKL